MMRVLCRDAVLWCPCAREPREPPATNIRQSTPTTNTTTPAHKLQRPRCIYRHAQHHQHNHHHHHHHYGLELTHRSSSCSLMVVVVAVVVLAVVSGPRSRFECTVLIDEVPVFYLG